MGTIVKIKNDSASHGGACTVSQWRAEFDSTDPAGWWSNWSEELYAGQAESQNLSQQGFDPRAVQRMRLSAYVEGHIGIIHSAWITYSVGQEFNFSLSGPSGAPHINGPE
jgi:hypothetical protein